VGRSLGVTIIGNLDGDIAVASGAVVLALGIASLVVAYALFKGRSWTWTAAVVLSIIDIIMSVWS